MFIISVVEQEQKKILSIYPVEKRVELQNLTVAVVQFNLKEKLYLPLKYLPY